MTDRPIDVEVDNLKTVINEFTESIPFKEVEKLRDAVWACKRDFNYVAVYMQVERFLVEWTRAEVRLKERPKVLIAQVNNVLRVGGLDK